MNITWDRRSHTWDREIILRTMMLGDDDANRTMIDAVGLPALRHIFGQNHNHLDRKSQIFWGHILGIVPMQPAFIHQFYVSSPSRHIASRTTGATPISSATER